MVAHEGLRGRPWDTFAGGAQEACLDICQEFVDEVEASPETPDGLTHRLRTGFTVKATEGGGGVVINHDAPYWLYVEHGHDIVNQTGENLGHVAARPFARAAWEVVRARHAAP